MSKRMYEPDGRVTQEAMDFYLGAQHFVKDMVKKANEQGFDLNDLASLLAAPINTEVCRQILLNRRNEGKCLCGKPADPHRGTCDVCHLDKLGG